MRKCRVDGCEETNIKGRDFCRIHYDRWWRHGNTDKLLTERQKLIKQGMSYCPCCLKEKKIENFSRDKYAPEGVSIYCRECAKEKKKIQYKKHKKRYRNYSLQHDFGITSDDYEIMLKKQFGKCAICGKNKNRSGRKLSVDHCHQTGKVRGILCDSCNQGLGMFKDNASFLRKTIEYLELYQ